MERVAMLVTSLAPGGAEMQVVRLSLELQSRGWRPAVISLLPPGALERTLGDGGIPVFSLGMKEGAADWRGLLRLSILLYRLRPAILHSHMFHANMMARAARLFCPVPVAVSSIHSVAESGRESRSLRARDWLYGATGLLADAVTAVCRAAAERHEAVGAARPGAIRVIPNGVDTSRFRPDPARRAETRAQLGLGSGFVWLSAGRLMWKKDYPTLLRAFAGRKDSTLLIAGDGPDEAALRALAAELEVNARFLGRVDDMPALMNAADAFALSSVVEGLPLALLEAAASGLPVVTTDAGGAREAVLDGATGFVVPTGRAAELLEAVERVETLAAANRDAMARAAREHAARFDIGRVAAQWEALYRELLETRRWT